MRILFIISTLLLCACSSSKSEAPKDKPTAADDKPPNIEAADFAMLCAEAKAAKGSSGEDRTKFASAVDSKLLTVGAKNTFGAAAAVADDQKLFMLKAGAKELGLADWDCPEIATLYGPQSDKPSEE
jgi:hypothetical protein